jgi:hypothetical protein
MKSAVVATALRAPTFRAATTMASAAADAATNATTIAPDGEAGAIDGVAGGE